MFICTKCLEKHKIPQGMVRSYGYCEICEQSGECYDSKPPIQKKVGIREMTQCPYAWFFGKDHDSFIECNICPPGVYEECCAEFVKLHKR